MNVLFDKKVEDFFFTLIETLYHEEYFGFYESAEYYVESLIDEITSTINNKLKKAAPKYFSKYGKGLYYVYYKKNKNTQWYVFFNYEADIDTYLIRYVANNHTCSQYL